ncbi:MAG: haloacid dehalogenase [Chloroflexi bacterium]|jgi:translin|nr:haloacid dehalogenase [Chloroflexota bacterium]
MTELNTDLVRIGEIIRANFTAKNEARDKAIKSSREAIYKCSTSIRAAHRGEYELASSLAAAAKAILDEVDEAIAQNDDLRYTGFVLDSQKEYAEARITLALVSGESIPGPDELGVRYSAYLNGLGEAAGELRRHILDVMRRGEVQQCEDILEMMDDIYSLLVTIDYPDAVTGGLRRTTDMVRGVLERSRGDLTVALRQRELETKLEAFNKNMEGTR